MINNINHFKSVSAYYFFVLPADQNYLMSRWTLISGVYPEFFWQASQAIEKYIKSGLLLNEHSTKKYGHDISKALTDYRSVFQDLFPSNFTKPQDLKEDLWNDESIDSFITRISRLGSTESRYGLTGWYRRTDDLFKIDQLIFHLRRLTIGLDWIVGDDFQVSDEISQFLGIPYSSALAADMRVNPRGAIADLDQKLECQFHTLGDIIHSWNFAFQRDPSDVDKTAPRTVAPLFGPARNSLIGTFIEYVENNFDNRTVATEGLRWIKDNIHIQNDVKSYIINRCATRTDTEQ